MKSWSRPEVPRLSGHGPVPRIFDTASRQIQEARPASVAGLYVCGITPYDATHIGHAATYLAFDILVRLWLDGGFDVRYVQNSTDVDDPLLERAIQTGVDWRELGTSETERFRRDMEALRIIPPDHYIAVTETIDEIAQEVKDLVDRGIGYLVGDDIYFDIALAEASSPWRLGDESHLDAATMLALSAERGGDPDRPGKRHPLDPMLWMAARDGEPSWQTVAGNGRPGWHIECSVITEQFLDIPVTVKGGGKDLIYPHHEFSAGHTAALHGIPLAELYSHAGLVAYEGEKMSKSLGNLVLVSALTDSGVDPRAIRLAILNQRYRDDWEWTDSLLHDATERLERWNTWAGEAGHPIPDDTALVAAVRAALAEDLDTRAAIAIIDRHLLEKNPPSELALSAIDALLGLNLG